ncbi:MAG: hypothetical protein KGY38_03155 [Desulfobacterales bacterium]|nr:hypothetical protein [Desulfobacterales bacterium]
MREKKNIYIAPSESAIPVVIRFAAYTLAIFIITASLTPLAEYKDIYFIFTEHGPVEWLQLGLLVAASVLFFSGFFSLPAFRELFLILASVSSFAAMRELDSVLDKAIPWIGWKVAFALLLFAAALAWKKKDKVKRQLGHYLSSPAFVVLWAGFIVAVPIAQLLGHAAFLESLMGENYMRAYKRVIEESGELLGYLLLLEGSIESLVLIKKLQIRKLPAEE